MVGGEEVGGLKVDERESHSTRPPRAKRKPAPVHIRDLPTFLRSRSNLVSCARTFYTRLGLLRNRRRGSTASPSYEQGHFRDLKSATKKSKPLDVGRSIHERLRLNNHSLEGVGRGDMKFGGSDSESHAGEGGDGEGVQHSQAVQSIAR